jgi:4-amino-4-deoxy-L-arabinose transferase-like glycosyltransferase
VWTAIEVAGLIAAFILQVYLSARQKSPILHENLYVYAGYHYLTAGAYRVNFDSPPLLKQLAALPLLALDATPPEPPPAGRMAPAMHRFFYQNRIPLADLLVAVRAPFLGLGIMLCLAVYCWARRLYGPAGGVLALWLCAFNPALIGEAGFANHDLGLASLSVVALYAAWRLCTRPRPGAALAAGLALGLALVTKFSALLLVPAIMMLGLGAGRSWPADHRGIHGLGRRAAWIGIVLAIAALVVWADYGFAVGEIRIDAYRQAITRVAPAGLIARLAATLPATATLPGSLYLEGALLQMLHGAVGHINYLFGEVSYEGWWYYYLVTVLYRTPLPLFGLVALRVVIGRPGGDEPARRGAETWLLAYAALTLVLFSASRTQLGQRYILVIYPLLFVWLGGLAGAVGAAGARVRGVGRALIAGCLIASAAVSLRAFPDYLMYFNALAGGPEAGPTKIIEGVDLGQDAAALGRFVAARNIERMAVSCFGCPPPEYLGPAFRPLGCAPTTGWVAVSVRQLAMPEPFLARGCFAWLADREPVARLGHSILVYHLDAAAK